MISSTAESTSRTAALPGNTGKRAMILALVLCGALSFRLAVFPTRIQGSSMEPNYHSGDYLLMKRFWPYSRNLSRFDIVTVRVGTELVTKRIIGLPGELLRMKNGVCFVDGKELTEPFQVLRGSWTIKPGLVQSNQFLLIGDNRELSEHSFFVVDKEAIVAHRRQASP